MRIMYVLIMAILLAITFYFPIKYALKLPIVDNLKNKNKLYYWLIIGFIALVIGIFLIIDSINTIVAILHLEIILGLCYLCGLLLEKKLNKKKNYYIIGIIAIFLTTGYLIYGYYMAHHVVETKYEFVTNKEIENLRIIEISDLHIGATIDSNKLKQELKKINDNKPDIFVLVGDIIDDNTSKDEMIKAVKYLGEIKTKYGIYYVDGNHDKSYFKNREFTILDFYKELENNNIIVLKDKAKLIADKYYLIGREDKSNKKRMEFSKLMKEIDPTKYIIVLDHQPTDYDEESKSLVDLVLSGHTHGGHIFPVGVFSKIFGINDQVYGTKKINNTNFIVTSGISGWRIKFKTFAKSEYVIIDIKKDV